MAAPMYGELIYKQAVPKRNKGILAGFDVLPTSKTSSLLVGGEAAASSSLFVGGS